MQGMAEKEEKPKEDSDIFTEIEDYTKEGYLLLQNGDVVNSCLAYEKAMQLALETKESFTERACFFNLGACCVAKGEASKGVEFLLRACPPDKESDGSMNFADLHYNLGVGYDFLGQPSKAKRCYETALEGYKSCSNMQMEGQVFLKLGGTLTSLNLLEKATEVFYEGEKIFQKLMDQKHEVLCLSSRATLMAEMRNEQCQELLKVVVNRVEELRDDLFKGWAVMIIFILLN